MPYQAVLLFVISYHFLARLHPLRSSCVRNCTLGNFFLRMLSVQIICHDSFVLSIHLLTYWIGVSSGILYLPHSFFGNLRLSANSGSKLRHQADTSPVNLWCPVQQMLIRNIGIIHILNSNKLEAVIILIPSPCSYLHSWPFLVSRSHTS